MRYLFLFFVCAFICRNSALAQDSLNMIRLAHWDDDSLPLASPGNLNLQYSGCWAMAVNGHEYAVLGGAAHVLIFDITQPETPQLVGKYAGSATTVWREFKSYKNRLYAVSDQTTEGLMIFDFSNAPDTIVRSYWSNEFFNKAHTIALDTVSGRIYLNGTDVALQGLVVLDVSQNPDQPQLLSAVTVDGGYIHDCYVRGDTVYASSGYDGYYVINMSDPVNPQSLAQISTGGYNHNSWLTTDGRYAYYTEEIPKGMTIKIVDLQDLANGSIEIAEEFLDPLLPGGQPLAIPHNVYIRDTLLFNSQYEDGLLVYNISNPLEPELIAYYDTHPENAIYNGYYGNWGNYPWLPSGTIVAGDMQNGLQILKLTTPTSGAGAPASLPVALQPNPASGQVNLRIPGTTTDWQFRVHSTTGRLMLQTVVQGSQEASFDVAEWPAGVYFVALQAGGKTAVRKIVVE